MNAITEPVLYGHLTGNPLFILGFLLISGFALGKLFLRIRLPEVSGFIIAGILLNSFTTGVVTSQMSDFLHVIAEMAIGFLALSIGSEFAIGKIRRIATGVLTITLSQLLLTVGLVTVGLLLFGMQLPYAVLLGVTACATSPALIVAEVHHLRAHGRFIDYLFGTIALIDAFSVVVFGVAFTFVTNYLGLSTHSVIGDSLREIVLSIGIGVAGGFLIHLLTTRNKNEHEILILAISFISMTTGISLVFHLSPLLLNMTTGAVLINLSARNHRIFKIVEPLTPPIYAMFFIIAGLELNPSILMKGDILLLAGAYFVLRAMGKYWGTWLGCTLQKTEPGVRKYLGLSMFSQAGVALGFVLLIQTSPTLTYLEPTSDAYISFSMMMKIVLISIFLNELLGPVFTRLSILRGNDMEE